MKSPSPVLADTGPDAGVPWHYGDPLREQRRLEQSQGVVDLSHRGVITVSGPDRLGWLHSLTTQQLADLPPHTGTTALVLAPTGHIEHVLYGVDDGETFWAHTEPGAAAALADWLTRMRFMMRVEVEDRSGDTALIWQPGLIRQPGEPGGSERPSVHRAGLDSLGGFESFVPRGQLAEWLTGQPPAGTWAYEARRIAAGVPRIGVDTDHRTIPNEVGLLGVAVHLDKGCYRGQETVARVHTLGRPPRRLVRLHFDGTAEALPDAGAPVQLGGGGKTVGFVGSSARHYELGPIGLGLLKRSTDREATLVVAGIPASQESLVDPEVGLHVRPRL